MTETLEHRLLKLLGVKYLHKVGCRLVMTEVWIFRSWDKIDDLTQKMDNKCVIDVAGLYDQPIFRDKRIYANGYVEREKVGVRQVSKGIEVKVSRQDFRNGFVCTGLNYHYVLVPQNLIELREVPSHIGILEYDPMIHPVDCYIRIKRRPKYQKTTDSQKNILENRIIERQHGAYMDIVRDQINILINKNLSYK
jgi:hypothetical protein